MEDCPTGSNTLDAQERSADFHGECMEKIRREAPKSYSASFWASNFSILFWEDPETLHFHDMGIFGRVHDSQNQSFLSLPTPGDP